MRILGKAIIVIIGPWAVGYSTGHLTSMFYDDLSVWVRLAIMLVSLLIAGSLIWMQFVPQGRRHGPLPKRWHGPPSSGNFGIAGKVKRWHTETVDGQEINVIDEMELDSVSILPTYKGD